MHCRVKVFYIPKFYFGLSLVGVFVLIGDIEFSIKGKQNGGSWGIQSTWIFLFLLETYAMLFEIVYIKFLIFSAAQVISGLYFCGYYFCQSVYV